MYDGIIFDKDGVLLDSAVNNFLWMDKVRINAAKKHGIEMDVDDAMTVAKASSAEKVQKLLNRKGASWKQLQKIENTVQDSKIRLMEEHYITPFPQVGTILDNLDVEKAVATNAPRRTTNFTFDHFGLEGHFRIINAPPMDPIQEYFNQRKPSTEMLEAAMNYMDCSNPVMVGDTESDIKAAENAGIDSILVESYGERPELDPTHRVTRLAELKRFIE
ncbi:HAD-IA family hydrolase [Candidatus Nanohaloarchaea archaeon]|nr:HAD-IA family hydrolase [Candidatus Nanohaloarchaea archaeon]